MVSLRFCANSQFDPARDAALSYDAAIAAIGASVRAGRPLSRAGYFRPATIPQFGASMTEPQIKYMIERFLGWNLPKDFRPDNGITYSRPNYHPSVDATPSGTNLFDYVQAEAMVRHMIEDMPS